ncbi:MAG: hypothetical protein Q4A12_01950 [Eubacteriales bacterium]|nr:hypothetical protein [Eubacteriales bacterium]
MENNKETLKHRLLLGACVSLFFVFTFVLYAPLKLYIENKDVLWFDFQSTLIVALVSSVVVFALMLLITSLPKKVIHTGLCCLVFAIALGLFLQGNFLNTDYGSSVLDGSEIAWKDYTTYGAINSAVWAACIAMPFAFWMVFREQWRKILIFSSLLLVVVQAIILGATLLQNSNNLHKITYEVTRDGIYELSEDENTIVFLLDSFDDEYFDKVKKDFPDYKERLSGFTEYSNTLATGSDTAVALPSALTGEAYTKDKQYSEYIDSSWNNSVYKLLHDKGVDTRIFAKTAYVGVDATEDLDNIVDYMDTSGAYTTMAGTMYKYAAYTYAPHYLKEYLWMDLDTISTYKSKNAYSVNDAQFYSDYVRSQGFTYTDDYKKSLRVYNLNGASKPYVLTRSTIKSINGSSLNDQIYGSFNCLFSMIEDLKQSGAYENATIIITASSGNKDLHQNPLMLIKEKGVTEGFEKSDAPVSLFDLAPTLASTVTKNYSTYGTGVSIFDMDEKTERTRDYYYNTGDNSNTRIEHYSTESSAADAEKMLLVDNYYSSTSVSKYKLGTSLTFAMDATANMYCTEGFSSTDGWKTYLAGPQSEMVIPISSIPDDAEDIHVFMGVGSVDKYTQVIIYANEKPIYSQRITKSLKNEGLNFTVPNPLIKDDNILSLKFVFPEISSEEFELTQDKRTKTFSAETFKMYTQ